MTESETTTESVGRAVSQRESFTWRASYSIGGRDAATGRRELSPLCSHVETLSGVIGHADRVGPLQANCIGLLLACERKSVEPM